jgi:hypothetical protein
MKFSQGGRKVFFLVALVKYVEGQIIFGITKVWKKYVS